jgi:hypothetical protein
MSVGGRAFSMQFRIEITPSTVPEWNAVPAYRAALERSLGADGAVGLQDEAGRRIAEFNALADRIYRNWRRAVEFA